MTSVHSNPSRPELLALGLREKLVDFVLAPRRTEGVFWYWCGDGNTGWPEDVAWPYVAPPDVTHIYRLWNCDAEQAVLWIRSGKQEFVWLYHDCEEHTLIARTENGLLADLFVTLIENQSYGNEEETRDSLAKLRAASELIGFQHFERLWQWSEGCQGISVAEYDARRKSLMLEMDSLE